jgi:hypothetical protein
MESSDGHGLEEGSRAPDSLVIASDLWWASTRIPVIPSISVRSLRVVRRNVFIGLLAVAARSGKIQTHFYLNFHSIGHQTWLFLNL